MWSMAERLLCESDDRGKLFLLCSFTSVTLFCLCGLCFESEVRLMKIDD